MMITTAWLLDDAALIERVLDHIDNRTTDLADDTWREPVANYRSPRRLAAEIQVLRRHPTALCPSAALAEPGSYVARDAAGVPIVAVRGHDGVVRAFRNTCRHRGATVAGSGGCAKSLVCPYHGWVYGLDGALRHVPGEDGFPGLDKDRRGLVALPAEERAGLVFVAQDPGGPALGWLPELVGEDQVLVDSVELPVEVNWKVFLEGFLEGYHIKATHRSTFLPFGYDNLTVVETYGPNSRITFPFRHIEETRDIPPAERQANGRVTFVHQLFPNVIVARLAHHTNVVVVEPVSIDRTNLVTYQLTNRGADPAARTDAGRDRDFVNLGTFEDREVAHAVQRGLASGANDTLEFGRFEGAITHFHRQLAQQLAGLDQEGSP